jgi:hypothetical protein
MGCISFLCGGNFIFGRDLGRETGAEFRIRRDLAARFRRRIRRGILGDRESCYSKLAFHLLH